MFDRTLAPVLVCILAASTGCGEDSPSGDALFSGSSSSALGSSGNQARCTTCHGVDPSPGNAGNHMRDIAFRSSFKGGGAPNLLAAVNACVTGWMGGDALTENTEAWVDLEAYLVSLSDPTVTTPNNFAPEVLADEAAYEAAYGGGDPGNGEAKFAAVCGRCHVDGLQIGIARSPTRSTIRTLSVGRIAQQVRTSGPPPSGMADTSDSTPGPMPFFEPRDLSMQDLKDIIAYVRQ